LLAPKTSAPETGTTIKMVRLQSGIPSLGHIVVKLDDIENYRALELLHVGFCLRHRTWQVLVESAAGTFLVGILLAPKTSAPETGTTIKMVRLQSGIPSLGPILKTTEL
jgi:hypothetical protein